MFRSIISLALSSLLFVASPAFGVFSEFVSVTPTTDNKHQHMRPVIKVEGALVTIRLPYRNDDKNYGRKYWLVVSDKPLTKEKQEFRGVLINGVGARSDILLMATLGPSRSGWGREMDNDKSYIFLHLTHELAQRAYIYHDYSGVVLDGGYYYTVDIPAYLPKKRQK